MRKRRYSKKMLSALMVPMVAGTMMAAPAFADVNVGEGETLTISGTANVERIIATGDDATVVLDAGAALAVDGYSPAIGLYADSTVTLEAGSSISATITDNNAAGIMMMNYYAEDTTSTVTLDDAGITATATGDFVNAAGIMIDGYYSSDVDTIISLDNGSSITAIGTATPAADVYGFASAGGIFADSDGEITITLDNGSTVSAAASATTTGTGSALVYASGIYAEGEDDGDVSVSLDNGSAVTATATAAGGENATVLYSTGVSAASWDDDGNVTVALDNASSVTLDATATVDSTETYTNANIHDIAGIYAGAYDGDITVSLDNGSSVALTATATNLTTGDSGASADVSDVYGIYAYADYGAVTVTLDNGSSVSVTTASTSHDYAGGEAVGIMLDTHEYEVGTVALSNGSAVTVSSTATVTDAAFDSARAETYAMGIDAYADYNDLTISLDDADVTATATSSLTSTGADVDNSDANADVYGIYAEGYAGTTTVTLDSATVTATATATNDASATTTGNNNDADAEAYGIYATHDDDGELTITLTDSTVAATATATAIGAADSYDGDAWADATGIYADGDDDGSTTVSLTNSSVTATATATAPDDAYADAYGIHAFSYYKDVTVTLDNATVTASATATSTTVGADGTTRADAEAYGIYAYAEYYGKTMVNLNDSTVDVNATADAIGDGAEGSAYADAIGIWAEAYEYADVEVTLANSTVTATATADGSVDADAYAMGIYAYAEYYGDVTVTLDDSSVVATATAIASGDEYSTESDAFADVYGVWAEVYEFGSTVTLTNSSVTATATAEAPDDAYAEAYGIYAYGEYKQATVTLDNSTVEASATATSTGAGTDTWTRADAEVTGIYAYADYYQDATVTLTNSSVTATATATTVDEVHGRANADAYGIYGGTDDSDMIVSLDGSTVTTTATADGAEYADAWAYGIYVDGYDNTMVTLTAGSTVTATATATASTDSIWSDAYAAADGIDAESGDYDVTVSLDGSSVTATAGASHSGVYGEACAVANAIDVDSDQLAIVSLTDSTATATATATTVDGFSRAEAWGMELDADDLVDVTLDNSAVSASSTVAADYGFALAIGIGIDGEVPSVITLDNSSITATTTATGEYAYGVAAGVSVEDDAVITLNNGSSISASTNNDQGGQLGFGVYAEGDYYDDFEVTVNIDQSSSVSGSEYAVYGDGGEGAVAVIVNNDGLVSGRLQITELNNGATGILEATDLVPQSPFLLVDANADLVVDAADVALTEAYNIVTDTATLADGSTVAVTMVEQEVTLYEGTAGEQTVADYGLGLSAPGETVVETGDGVDTFGVAETVEYRVLGADTGAWTLANIELQQSLGYSPMLDLTWHELSDENDLVISARFLTPAEAGLSSNATGAFTAAFADGLFTFASSPEDWTPDVSGANMNMVRQSNELKNRSIERRRITQHSSLYTGINTGDAAAVNGMWADVRYTDVEQDKRDGIDGYESDTTALTIGYDRQLNTQTTLGMAFSFATSDADLDNSDESFDSDDYLITLYGGYDTGSWFVDGQLTYGWGDIDGKRTLGTTQLKSSYDSNVYYAQVVGGLKYLAGGWLVTPQAFLDYTLVDLDDYTEKGGVLALDVSPDDYDICNLGVGIQLTRTWKVGEKILLTPEFGAMVYYDLIGDEIETSSTFIGGTTKFVTKGADADETTYDLSAGLTFGGVDSPLSMKVGYEYLGREDFGAHSVNGKLRYEF